MHEWSDDWFKQYGDQLYQAESYIRKTVRRYGLCYLSTKEKYGTIRYEDIYIDWCKYGSFWWRLHHKWAKFILDRAIKKAIRRWPDISVEILDDYEPECL